MDQVQEGACASDGKWWEVMELYGWPKFSKDP